jgi:hypothetical protein
MSQMTTDTPRVRTSDAERERIAQTLREAVGEGRLTLDEGDERLATLYTTKYRDELAPLIADLPAAGPGRQPSGRGRGRGAPDGVWSPEAGTDEYGTPQGGARWGGYQGYGPPWAGPGWGGHEHGAPGSGDPGQGWGRRPGPPWFLLPLLPILFVFLMFGAIGGIVHGHLFALIPLAFLTFAVLRIVRFRHRWGGWRR